MGSRRFRGSCSRQRGLSSSDLRFTFHVSRITYLIGVVLVSLAICRVGEAAEDPSAHAYPALGASIERKVRVEWNQFYDHAGLSNILARLRDAFPELTQLHSLGKSVEGRDLWCLEITSRKGGDAKRKPGMFAMGNIHGNEVQGGEALAYTAWYLCHQYGRLERVTDLLDHSVLYLLPTINPDGRDRWLRGPGNSGTHRSGVRPEDDDRDGLFDEDDVDDLDGDGSITQMRIKDPNGRWRAHPDYPELLMMPAPEGEKGEYTLLGSEGLDNDGDGLVNEDPVGGYDMNRNWAWDWQPEFIQGGSREYPFCLPETRAVADFVLARPNIAGFQSFHNAGGMILRSPGREGGTIRPSDDRVMQFVVARGEKMLPFYRSMIIGKDLYTVWGGEVDWFYGARGILGFVNEMWSSRNLDKAGAPQSREDEAAFLRYVLLNDGVVKWHEFDHPTYGKIEIGGTKKEWGRTPVSFMMEEDCHRNMAFVLFFASQMPRLSIRDVAVEDLGANLYKVWVTIENSRSIPTRTDQDVQNKIGPPDIVLLSGPSVKVISAGRVTDRFFKRVEAVKRRPERIELTTIGGMSEERVQFVISGRGAFTVSVDSAKGGVMSAERILP